MYSSSAFVSDITAKRAWEAEETCYLIPADWIGVLESDRITEDNCFLDTNILLDKEGFLLPNLVLEKDYYAVPRLLSDKLRKEFKTIGPAICRKWKLVDGILILELCPLKINLTAVGDNSYEDNTEHAIGSFFMDKFSSWGNLNEFIVQCCASIAGVEFTSPHRVWYRHANMKRFKNNDELLASAALSYLGGRKMTSALCDYAVTDGYRYFRGKNTDPVVTDFDTGTCSLDILVEIRTRIFSNNIEVKTMKLSAARLADLLTCYSEEFISDILVYLKPLSIPRTRAAGFVDVWPRENLLYWWRSYLKTGDEVSYQCKKNNCIYLESGGDYSGVVVYVRERMDMRIELTKAIRPIENDWRNTTVLFVGSLCEVKIVKWAAGQVVGIFLTREDAKSVYSEADILELELSAEVKAYFTDSFSDKPWIYVAVAYGSKASRRVVIVNIESECLAEHGTYTSNKIIAADSGVNETASNTSTNKTNPLISRSSTEPYSTDIVPYRSVLKSSFNFSAADEEKRKKRYTSPKCGSFGEESLLSYLRNELPRSPPALMEEHTLGVPPARGVCGLGNIGNTCFMNSLLQCLSSVEIISRYFVDSDKFLHEINEKNPLGRGGKIAREFALLMKAMWCGEYRVASIRAFKQVIGEFATQFLNFQQQDSQEFMQFVLDGLHEDLNRVQKKPYVEEVDSDGRPDAIVAKETWSNFIKRNDSFLVDSCFGLIKSHVTCGLCQAESVTFDPYNCLSLPLPIKKSKCINVSCMLMPGCTPTPFTRRTVDIIVTETSTISSIRDELQVWYRKIYNEILAENGLSNTFCEIYNLAMIEYVSSFVTIEKRGIDLQFVDPLIVVEESCGILNPLPFELELFSPVGGLCSETLPFEGMRDMIAHHQPSINFVLIENFLRSCGVTGAEFLFGLVDVAVCERAVPSRTMSEKTYGSPSRRWHPLFPFYESYYERMLRKISPSFRLKLIFKISPNYLYELMMLCLGVLPNSLVVQPAFEGSITSGSEEIEYIEYDSGGGRNSGKTAIGYTLIEGKIVENLMFVPFEIALSERHDRIMQILDWENNPKFEASEKFEFRYEEGAPCFSVVFSNTCPYLPSIMRGDKLNIRTFCPTMVCVHSETVSTPPISLDDCFKKFCDAEQMADTETFYCRKCKGHSAPKKQMSIYTLPDVLVLHLKRFRFAVNVNFMYRDKISTIVDFPCTDLDLSSYVHSDVLQHVPHSPYVYDLSGVSEHVGGTGGGHYTATCKNYENGKWYGYNDSCATECSSSKAVSEAAYVLFYKRRNGSHRWGGMQVNEEPTSAPNSAPSQLDETHISPME